MARFEIQIINVWRLNRKDLKSYWPARNRFKVKSPGVIVDNEESADNLVPVWVRWIDLQCKCPEMELGRSYLIVTDFEYYKHSGKSELLFTAKTAILPWQSTWNRRLTRFRRRENRGDCDRFRDPARLVTRHDRSMRLGKPSYGFRPWRYGQRRPPYYTSDDALTYNNNAQPTGHQYPSIQQSQLTNFNSKSSSNNNNNNIRWNNQ